MFSLELSRCYFKSLKWTYKTNSQINVRWASEESEQIFTITELNAIHCSLWCWTANNKNFQSIKSRGRKLTTIMHPFILQYGCALLGKIKNCKITQVWNIIRTFDWSDLWWIYWFISDVVVRGSRCKTIQSGRTV